MDREKIKKALEICAKGCNGDGCRYSDEAAMLCENSICTRCVDLLARDVLELLSEEDPVKPKVEKAVYDYECWHYVCGACGKPIDKNDNFCRHCGRSVEHDEF